MSKRSPTFANCSKTKTSMPFPSRRRTIGTRLRRFGRIQAGKDVYLEKPVSHNVWEGRKIVEAARKYKKIVQTGTQARSSTASKKPLQWVQRRQPRQNKDRARALLQTAPEHRQRRRAQRFPITSITICGAAPRRWTRCMRKRNSITIGIGSGITGNGDLGNQGIHQMDIARWFLGEKELSPRVFQRRRPARLQRRWRNAEHVDGFPRLRKSAADFRSARIAGEIRRQRKWINIKAHPSACVIECENGDVLFPAITDRRLRSTKMANEIKEVQRRQQII